MKSTRNITILLVLLVTVFAVHVFYINTEGARLDFTSAQLYTLTDGSQQIIDKMKDEGVKPVEIKLYFSATAGKTLPRFIKNFITYKSYVHNLLREYERAAEGKIRISVIDPKTDSDDALDAEAYRLDGKPINNEGDRFFFGMVFETQTGSKDVIDFLWPEKQETIEYEISKKIYNLVWPAKKRIAVMSGINPLPDPDPYYQRMMAAQNKQPEQPWTAITMLQESYEVSRLDPDVETISKDDYELLIVIHPTGFGDKQLWAIDEWVVTGGDTLVFIDPYCIEDQPPPNPQNPWAQLQYKPSSNLTKLMDKWGVTRVEDQFAVDHDLALKRPVDRSNVAYKIINDLAVDDKTIAQVANQDLPIFNGLANLRFYTPGVLETTGTVEHEITPLLTTTDRGDSLEIIPGFGDGGKLAYTDFQQPNKLLSKYQPEKKITLAYLLQGKLPTAFPEGASFPKEAPQRPPGLPPGMEMPVPEGAEMITKEAVAADKHGEARVLLFADTDFITNQLAFQQSIFGTTAINDNFKVLINSVDFLMGAKELMAVRSKKAIRRPFEAFDRIEAQADLDMLGEEQKIRDEVDAFREDLRQKQSSLSQKDAALFEKNLADDINSLNERIREGEQRLREIRKAKRGLLEDKERQIWVFNVAAMPVLICAFGLFNWLQRRRRHLDTRRG